MKKLLIPALLLASLVLQPSVAAADNNGIEWRSGNRSDIWYRYPGDNNWRRAPGSAREVGDGWVIGTDRRNGGYSIYRWDGRKWHRMPGSGVRIGGGYYDPWVVNDRGERFRWTGSDWRQEPNFDRRDDRRDDNRGRDDNDWNRGRDRDNDNNRGGRRDNDRGQNFGNNNGDMSNWLRDRANGERDRNEDQWRRNRNR